MKKIILILTLLFQITIMKSQTKSIYDYSVKDIDGKMIEMKQFTGKKLIIVNVASECGNTPQYAQLEEIYQKYKSKNVVVIGFPANNFGGQEPGSEKEIKSFCSSKYHVTFPMMSKVSAKGNDMAPIYQWLTQKKLNGKSDAPVTWNFQKFLIDEKGNWIDVEEPGISPLESVKLMNFIQPTK